MKSAIARRPEAAILVNAKEFQAATWVMTPAMVGGTMALLANLHLRGSLPDDDTRLMPLAGMTAEEWAEHPHGPRMFFTRCPDGALRLAPEMRRVVRLRRECCARRPRKVPAAPAATNPEGQGCAEVAPPRAVNEEGG